MIEILLGIGLFLFAFVHRDRLAPLGTFLALVFLLASSLFLYDWYGNELQWIDRLTRNNWVEKSLQQVRQEQENQGQ